MIINPQELLLKAAIFPVDLSQIQPNSVDLTVESISSLPWHSLGRLTKLKSELPEYQLIAPKDGFVKLSGGKGYNVRFDQWVKVPENMVGIITHRSSLNRMGCTAVSGLYDSGFNNYVGAMLYPTNDVEIEIGARIATIYFLEAEASKQYVGQYQSVSLPAVNPQ